MHFNKVTLYTRVWIEISIVALLQRFALVTLYTRVWIEITLPGTERDQQRSHPLHEGVD